MTDFVLIDLCSQAKAVWQHTHGWTKLAILVWLDQRGEVTTHPTHTDFYWFRSEFGIETGFRLTENREFYIYFGEHIFRKIDETS